MQIFGYTNIFSSSSATIQLILLIQYSQTFHSQPSRQLQLARLPESPEQKCLDHLGHMRNHNPADDCNHCAFSTKGKNNMDFKVGYLNQLVNSFIHCAKSRFTTLIYYVLNDTTKQSSLRVFQDPNLLEFTLTKSYTYVAGALTFGSRWSITPLTDSTRIVFIAVMVSGILMQWQWKVKSKGLSILFNTLGLEQIV